MTHGMIIKHIGWVKVDRNNIVECYKYKCELYSICKFTGCEISMCIILIELKTNINCWCI